MASFISSFLTKKKVVIPKEVINHIVLNESKKYAENNLNNLFLDFEELGGFPFIKSIIVGNLHVKIKRTGCKVSFIFEDERIILDSDNTTIESNEIRDTKIYFTEIDFELNNLELEKIQSKKITGLEFNFGSKKEFFTKI